MHLLIALSQHIKLHSKPWGCEHCDKKFGLRTDLHRHIRSRHRVGNIKFSCTLDGCSFKATRKDNVVQHLRKSHGIKSKIPRCRQDKSSTKDAADESTCSEGKLETPPMFTWVDLMEAASVGNVSRLHDVLNAGIDVDSQADDGFTALHCAARSGHTEAVSTLLEAKARRGTLKPDSSYYSIILQSIKGKSLECCQLLLNTPTGSQIFTETSSLVPADIRGETKKIVSWSFRLRQLADQVTQSDSLKIAQYLFDSISASQKMSTKNEASKEFAYFLANAAARHGRLRILHWLGAIYPAVFAGDREYRKMPLYAAVSQGQIDCVRLLLPYLRADKNWLSRSSPRVTIGYDIFCAAVKRKLPETVRTFLEVEPRLLVNDFDRNEILERAVHWESLETVRVILQCRPIDTSIDTLYSGALFIAAKDCSLEITRALLEHGFRDTKAFCPTFWSWKRSHSVRQLLLRYMVQDSSSIDDEPIQTRAQLADFLFNVKGYHYRAVNLSDNSLLHLAVNEHDCDLLKVLLSLDSISSDDLNEKIYGNSWTTRKLYRTPLNYARNRGYTDIAELLSAHGATDSFYDPDGKLAAGGY